MYQLQFQCTVEGKWRFQIDILLVMLMKIQFSSLDVTVSVEDIYYQVNHEDVLVQCRKKLHRQIK